MVNRISLTVLIIHICFLVSILAKSDFDMFDQRQLSTCSSYSTCDECNADITCATISGSCTNDPGTSIRTKQYDQSTQYSNCKNAKQDGYLYIGDNHLDSAVLGHEEGAPVDNPDSICEWKFVMESFDDISIKISKDTANYENLYIYAMTLNGSKYFYLKELSSCDSDTLELEFNKIKYLSIRADKLSAQSNYSIVVERINIADDIMTSIFVSIILGLVMLIFASVTFILLFLSCKQWLKERRLRIETEFERRKLANNKEQWIDDTLASMTTGLFVDVVQKFKQEN